MRRILTAIVAVGALVALTAAPAGAQEELGFETNILEGQPGEVVAGQVDPDDVAEHCRTDLEEFQARWGELLEGPYAPEPGNELFDRIQPSGDFEFENHTQLAYTLTGFVILGLSGLIGPEPAEEALPQTFVLTFADIATQEPVGELSNFDPETGEGTVVVPDIEPGLWAVAAVCVGPTFDVDLLEAGLQASGEFLEELGVPVDPNTPEFAEFVQDFLDDPNAGIIEFVTEIGPELVQNIVEIEALGAVIFCILDENGECPEDDGDGDGEPGDGVEPPTAIAVVTEPGFTG